MVFSHFNSALRALVTLVIFSAITLTAYNNCGQNRYNTDLAYKGLNEVQKDFAKTVASHYSAEDCENLESYSCMQRSFAPDVKNGEKAVDFPCATLDDGRKLCVSGTLYTFDTSSQIETCNNCDENDINSRYDFDEYICYHRGIKMNGINPVRADGSNLNKTLLGTYKTCKNLLGNE